MHTCIFHFDTPSAPQTNISLKENSPNLNNNTNNNNNNNTPPVGGGGGGGGGGGSMWPTRNAIDHTNDVHGGELGSFENQ